MLSETLQKLHAAVRDVPDFPEPGIIFKDITPILSDGELFRASIDLFSLRSPDVDSKGLNRGLLEESNRAL